MDNLDNEHLRPRRTRAWVFTRCAAVSLGALCTLAACGAEPANSTDASPAATLPRPAGAAGGGAVTTPTAMPAKPAATAATTAATSVAAPTPSSNTPAPAGAAPTPTPTNTPTAASASAGALPCGVSKVLASACQNCHGAMPIGGAPMSLVTYADLMKPAVTQPNKKVYELVQTRVHDSMRPMPPTGALSAADLAAIDEWC